MTEGEELPSWTGGPQQGTAPANRPEQQRSRGGRRVLVGLLGLAVLIGMGAIGYAFAQRQAENETAADDTEEVAGPSTDESSSSNADDADQLESEEASEDDATLTVDIDESETAEADSTDQSDGDTDEDDTASGNGEDDGDETSADAADGDSSTRTAVFRGGKVYLGGKVPSQEIADIIEGKAAAVLGPDNVVVEYEIDPSVTIDPGESTPLFVEDVVLFRFNSVSIDPPFLPLLDIGAALLLQNPQASLTVVTRTDAVGSEEINLDVATRRAKAVTDYLERRGVSPDQVLADPRGEEGSSDDDDEQTAALQRRAEFVITGLLD